MGRASTPSWVKWVSNYIAVHQLFHRVGAALQATAVPAATTAAAVAACDDQVPTACHTVLPYTSMRSMYFGA